MTTRILMALSLAFLIGCGGGTDKPPAAKTPSASKSDVGGDTEIKAELAKLSKEDRELVEAQQLCTVTDEPLGSMGAPIKLTIKGKPVFICCAGCKKKAEADPDKTLAKVEEFKARKKSGKSS